LLNFVYEPNAFVPPLAENTDNLGNLFLLRRKTAEFIGNCPPCLMSGEGEAHKNKINSLWWCLLDSARTFFQSLEA
jgi:hypothetical protein